MTIYGNGKIRRREYYIKKLICIILKYNTNIKIIAIDPNMNYTQTDFEFIHCEQTRQMISRACMCLDESDWSFMKHYYINNNESYMFSQNVNIKNIMNKIQDSYHGNHTGNTIGFTMRAIDLISKVGLQKYKMLSNN